MLVRSFVCKFSLLPLLQDKVRWMAIMVHYVQIKPRWVCMLGFDSRPSYILGLCLQGWIQWWHLLLHCQEFNCVLKMNEQYSTHWYEMHIVTSLISWCFLKIDEPADVRKEWEKSNVTPNIQVRYSNTIVDWRGKIWFGEGEWVACTSPVVVEHTAKCQY